MGCVWLNRWRSVATAFNFADPLPTSSTTMMCCKHAGNKRGWMGKNTAKARRVINVTQQHWPMMAILFKLFKQAARSHRSDKLKAVVVPGNYGNRTISCHVGVCSTVIFTICMLAYRHDIYSISAANKRSNNTHLQMVIPKSSFGVHPKVSQVMCMLSW